MGVMEDAFWDRWEIHRGRNVSTLWVKCRYIVGETGGALCESHELHRGRDGRYIMGEMGYTLRERWDIYCGRDGRCSVGVMGDTL